MPELEAFFREDGCSGEAEEVVVAEGSRDVGVHVAELAAVTFVEDEDDVPGVDGVPAVALDEGRELLDGGDDDRRGRVVDLLGELACGLVGGNGSLGEGVIFADGLVVEVLAVDDEENLVDPFHSCSELCALEGREGLSGAGGVPDVAAGFFGAEQLGVVIGDFDALNDFLGCRDLVGAHDEAGPGLR